MKTLLPVIIALGLFAASCSPSQKQQAESETLAADLRIQREELNRLRSLDENRRRWYVALVAIQSRVEDLEDNLKLASTEIWGDGSSTGARLSTAHSTITSIQADLESLGRELLTGTPGQ